MLRTVMPVRWASWSIVSWASASVDIWREA
jgi:hypothetical protein